MDKKVKAWGITDWGGGMNYPSVSIFDTKKEAKEELAVLDKLPNPTSKGANKIIRVLITWEEGGE